MNQISKVIFAIVMSCAATTSIATPATQLKDIPLDKLSFFVAGVIETSLDEPYIECLPENITFVDLAQVVQRAILKYPSYLNRPSSVFVRAAIANAFCQKDPQKPAQTPKATPEVSL